jgi:1-deoxy-D-xylulose-5-phosphate synthase
MAPKDENELGQMLRTALEMDGPTAIRYPRGSGAGVEIDPEMPVIDVGKGEIVREGDALLFVCFGTTVSTALSVSSKLEEEFGIQATVINARFAKPLDKELLRDELPKYKHIYTIEDHARIGGFGSALLEFIEDEQLQLQGHIHRFGILDKFLPHASQAEQYADNGYDAESVFNVVQKELHLSRNSRIAVG